MVKSAHPLSPVDNLISKVGIGIVQTVEARYQTYLDNPTPGNARSYQVWRLRLHQKMKDNVSDLRAINDARNLGLEDTSPGRTFWDCEF